jgi:hypothetical protein
MMTGRSAEVRQSVCQVGLLRQAAMSAVMDVPDRSLRSSRSPSPVWP